ncbi:putative transporter svop-1 [Diplonema papillatum]|nr:putative transporter svop-1 [Diplonema papillatum]
MKIAEALDSIGYGPFQKRHVAKACATGAVVAANLMLMYYVAIPPSPACGGGACEEDEPPSGEAWCKDPASHRSRGWAMQGPSSVFSTWPSLVCEESWAVPMSQSLFFVGWMLSALTTGRTADTYGRKKPLVASLLGLAVTCVLTGLSGYSAAPYLYMASKLLHGAAVGCCLLFVYVFGSELIPSAKGSFFGTTYFMIAALGSTSAAVIGHVCQHNWQLASLVTGLAALPCVWWPLSSPESPVWLATTNVAAALAALQAMAPAAWKAPKAAARQPDSDSSDADNGNDDTPSEASTANRAPPSKRSTNESCGLSSSNVSKKARRLVPETTSPAQQQAGGASLKTRAQRSTSLASSCDGIARLAEVEESPFAALFAPDHLPLTLNLTFCWFGCSLCYFGLGLGGATLPGDYYQNGALLSLVEIPVYWVLDVLMGGEASLVSRKSAMVGSCAVAAVSCLSFFVLPLAVAKWVSFVGQMFTTAAFTVVYIWTAELLRSNLKATGMGVCIAAGKLGSIAAPYTVMLAGKSLTSAMGLYGGLALLAMGAACKLPVSLKDHDAGCRTRVGALTREQLESAGKPEAAVLVPPADKTTVVNRKAQGSVAL